MRRPTRIVAALALCGCPLDASIIGETAESGVDTSAGPPATSEDVGDGVIDDGASGPLDPAGTSESSGTDTSELGPLEQQRCPEIVAQSAYCLTHRYEGDATFVLVGVDSGDDCILSGSGALIGLPPSVAWIGDHVVTGLYDSGVARVDLATSSLIVSEPAMEAVTENAGQLLTQGYLGDMQVLRQFATFEDLVAGEVVRELSLPHGGSLLATAEGILFVAWHSTDFVERYDLATLERLADLPLEGHDDWVKGMSIVGDRLWITDGKERLREFDASTGAHLRDLPLGFDAISGLACRPGL